MRSYPMAQTSYPFGGCSRLLTDYRTIGRELLAFEQANRLYGYRSFRAFTAFREGVVFVSVEVLESYLEDLLDLEVPEEKLCIQREAARFRGLPALCFSGMVTGLGIGLFAARTGASLLLSSALAVAIAAPFAILWHFSPRSRVTRRMLFARVLSQEISRRRGRDKDEGAGIMFERFMAKKGAGSMQGAARGSFGLRVFPQGCDGAIA